LEFGLAIFDFWLCFEIMHCFGHLEGPSWDNSHCDFCGRIAQTDASQSKMMQAFVLQVRNSHEKVLQEARAGDRGVVRAGQE
jgi:hypothetical protein